MKSESRLSIQLQPCRMMLAAILLAVVTWSLSLAGSSQPTAASSSPPKAADRQPLAITERMRIPAWAFAERALLSSTADAARLWADRYLDANGEVDVVERWGVSDGPDDIMETLRGWPLAYAMGAPDSVNALFEKAWEGHLRQFTRAKVPTVELARDGIYYKEFTTSYDWEHIGEGLQAFYYHGLGRPGDPGNVARARRFAGFYLNEDPAAANYDPEHKIIRSLFNGSRGPKLTPATPVDWDGDADPQRAQRFATSSNVRGDHPLNLHATTLAAQAYLLTGEPKYRRWLLEYVDAWRDRANQNGGNLPSNIGLDGTIGGEWSGKWYGGVFGWNSPDTGLRNYVLRGPVAAFGQALLLTGDYQYVDVLRRQVDNLFAAKRVENGQVLLPHYYGEKDGKVGWYGYREGEFHATGALGNLSELTVQLYLWSFSASDRARILAAPRDRRDVGGWIEFLEGRRPDYPLEAMQDELRQAARAVERVRTSKGGYSASPVVFESLANLTLGAPNLYGSGDVVHGQVRYFDPVRRRAGLSEDVAALVETIGSDGITLTLVNTNLVGERSMIVQMGAYGEHQCVSITAKGKVIPVEASSVEVRLAPGAGETLKIAMKRYVNAPTLLFPWDRGR
jgi:hypothetical protein